jgi:hypothetical protein
MSVKLSDIKLVLKTVPHYSRPRRKAFREAMLERLNAERAFEDRATPASWSRLVLASRNMLAAERAERAFYVSTRMPAEEANKS